MTAQLAQAAADDHITLREALAEPRRHRHAGEPGCGQPPPDVAAQRPLRQRRQLLPDGDLDLPGVGQLERDLLPRVGPADDKDPSFGQIVGALIGRAMELGQLGIELVGDRRRERDLERSGGDDDLVGSNRAGGRLGEISAVVGPSSGGSRSCSAAPAARTSRHRPEGSRRRRPCPGRYPARPGNGIPGRSLYRPAVNSFSDCQRERHIWPTSGLASAITNESPRSAR